MATTLQRFTLLLHTPSHWRINSCSVSVAFDEAASGIKQLCGDESPMTEADQLPTRLSFFRFRLLALLLLVTVIALWLAMWRAVGPAIIFITACVPIGLLIYGAACVGARYGYPILVGALTGVVFGILGTTVSDAAVRVNRMRVP